MVSAYRRRSRCILSFSNAQLVEDKQESFLGKQVRAGSYTLVDAVSLANHSLAHNRCPREYGEGPATTP